MKKRATPKKIADKSEKKRMNRKHKTTLEPARKAFPKKKSRQRAKTKNEKPAIKKIKGTVKIKEEPKETVAGTARKPKTAAKKVTTRKKEKVKGKIRVKPKKTSARKIIKKPAKVAKRVVAKVEKKRKKIIAGVVVGIREKIRPEIKKITARKIFGKPEEKVQVKVEAETEEKLKKIVSGIKEKPAVTLTKKGVLTKVGAEKKKADHAVEEKYPPAPLETLPGEYGENSITLITVDPCKLFSYWEVREEILEIFTGSLNVRVYDVTGIDFDSRAANSFFDIAVTERIGSCYIDVGPAKEFITDIGIIYLDGIFISIARSNKVSTPRSMVSEEGLLPQKFYETGLFLGY